MAQEVREPQQERSIEKKNKIIEASYQLFSEVGYYGTNTAEIAKQAGVSTGIIYGYFKDKRDILICVLSKYIDIVVSPVYALFDSLKVPIDFENLLNTAIDMTIKTHKKNAKIHEALHSLTSTDEAVKMEFMSLENNITKTITNKFEKLGVNIENSYEKVHIALNLIQSFAHESVFDKHDYIDYQKMRELVVKMLLDIFT